MQCQKVTDIILLLLRITIILNTALIYTSNNINEIDNETRSVQQSYLQENNCISFGSIKTPVRLFVLKIKTLQIYILYVSSHVCLMLCF